MSVTRVLWFGLALLYPAIVYFGLQSGQWGPRQIGVLLLFMAAARLFLRGRQRPVDGWLILLPLLVALPALLFNQPIWVLLYPALVSALFLSVFALSLVRPPTAIETIARLRTPDLSATAVDYTRKVTQAWCFFFAGNGLIALMTALFASHAVWALYNGAISYGLMGLMFAGEWLIRRHVMAREAH
ncbi:MAG: hypothetical protein EPO06_03965 [Burkholderiaceae bacterium]|nr:MAG: hypothetical protein EPO06_03965 [Burkholderiaceae bacterium]